MAAGSKIGRNTPLLGLAFLISAITAERPAAILARSAPAKSRREGDAAARLRISLKGTAAFAAASSLTLVARIRVRMSRVVTVTAPLWAPNGCCRTRLEADVAVGKPHGAPKRKRGVVPRHRLDDDRFVR